jgi:Rieske Fe-S protein
MKDFKSVDRRQFVKLCVGATALVASRPALLAEAATGMRATGTTSLVDPKGRPLAADELTVGENFVFLYPYVTTPCFVIDLGKPANPVRDLKTADGTQYGWSGGVGPRRSIVAFSAICAHRMTYPTPTVSFIKYRHEEANSAASGRMPARRGGVIRCCSEGSEYDPADGARVLGGPAPQPLAAVELDYNEDGGTLTAVGIHGGDMFDRFFEEFGFQLALQHRISDITKPVGKMSRVWPLSEYSENLRRC